jgi:TM2 domain-containing membrane protein YozV
VTGPSPAPSPGRPAQGATGGTAVVSPADANKKLIAGICAIVLGGLGVHKFILGYNTEGAIMLAASTIGGLLTCGIASIVVGICGVVEGIIYLTKSDADFVTTYIKNKKGWF